MSFVGSDLALRRLVAKLSTASRDDVEAVLGALDPGAQARVRNLLADYSGEPTEPSQPARCAEVDDPRLSVWLRSRLRLDALTMGGFSMTPTAAEALRSVAAGLPRDNRARARRSGSGALERLAGAVEALRALVRRKSAS